MGRGKHLLPAGARKLIEAINRAEENGTCAEEAKGLLLGVMRGEIRGRHLRERLTAAAALLDRYEGKPRQSIDVTTTENREVFRVELPDGTAVHTAETEDLPN